MSTIQKHPSLQPLPRTKPPNPSPNLIQAPDFVGVSILGGIPPSTAFMGKNLTFYTGTSYLAGSIAGASTGLYSVVKSFESGDTTKLKLNRILNSSGLSGRTWGNRIGIVGLIYAGVESVIVVVRDEDDVWSCITAGLATGAVCRAARGVKSASVAGALGGLVAGTVVAGK